MNETVEIIPVKTGRSPLLTCAEGAAFLGLSRSAFWNKCRQGEIPHIRLSRRAYRVRPADLEAFISARTR
jgi:excisionase family DNA binding protein